MFEENLYLKNISSIFEENLWHLSFIIYNFVFKKPYFFLILTLVTWKRQPIFFYLITLLNI